MKPKYLLAGSLTGVTQVTGWTSVRLDLDVMDRRAASTLADVAVGDVVQIDASAVFGGLSSLYTITSVITRGTPKPTSLVVTATYVAEAGIAAPDLSWCIDAVVTLMRLTGKGVGSIAAPGVHAIPDAMPFAAINAALDALAAAIDAASVTPGPPGMSDTTAAASTIGSGSAATATLDLSGHTYVNADVPLTANTVFSAGTKVAGGQIYLRLVADAVHAPTFAAMLEHGSSQGWDGRVGVVNIVLVWYDGVGVWYSITQAANASAVLPTAPAITSAPAVTLAQVGSPVTWTAAAASGSPLPTITYDVLIGGTVVAANATSGSYTPTASGGSLVVRATATNASGSITSSSTAVTVATAPVATAPTVTAAPAVSSATVGTPLTFTAGTFAGSPTPTVVHDVLIGGSLVASGVTSGSYTPTVSGGSLVVRATATNASGSITSSSTAVTVAAAPAATAPTITVAPTVASATVGTPLTWTAATATGSPTPSVSYDVLIGGSVVAAGATSGSYTPTAAGGSLVVRATATNSAGSVQSSSVAVTVAAAPTIGYLALAPKTGLTETGDATAGYTYTAPSGDSSYQGTAAGIVPKKIPSGANGYYEITLASVSPGNNGPLLGLRADANLGAYPSCYMTVFCLNGGNYSRSTAGAAAQPMDVTLAYAAGDVVRIGRETSGIVAKVSKDNGATFTTIQTWPNQAGDLFGEIILASGSVTKITGSGLV